MNILNIRVVLVFSLPRAELNLDLGSMLSSKDGPVVNSEMAVGC